MTAWKPLTEAKWVHLDEEELAYGSLDKDGFELVCGAALYLVLIGTAWIILPVIFSTIVMYTILAFKPHFDTELVYWGLLMLSFGAQRVTLNWLRKDQASRNISKVPIIIKMYFEACVALAAVVMFM